MEIFNVYLHLEYLEGIVASGNKTSLGFKQVHLKACAKALNDHFNINLTSDQITNHIRTWKRKYSKIADLRKLSAALWDDDNFIISLDHKHYADHIKVCHNHTYTILLLPVVVAEIYSGC